MASKEELEKLNQKVEKRIKQLGQDREKLHGIANPAQMDIENLDIVPIIQETIKGDGDPKDNQTK